MDFTLSVNGADAVTFESLGVVSAQLEISNQGLDRLQLSLSDDVALAAFPAFARVELTHSGQVRFVGWVDQIPSSYTGDKRVSTVTISGPWRWLDMTAFTDKKTILVPGTTAGSYESLDLPVQIPMVGQGIDPITGMPVKIPLSDVVKKALDQVIAAQGAVISYDLSGLPSVQLPWAEKQNITVGSVVREQLSWAPDRSVVWDYSNAVPKLRIGGSPAGKQVTDVGVDATQLALNPRFDLLVRRVTITYLSPPSNGIYKKIVDEAKDQGDALALNSKVAVEMTFPLQQNEPLPVAGLASTFLASVSKLAIETSFTFLDETLAWDCLPGQQWGFGGVSSRWASYASVCQTITRDLFSSSVTVKLGHPGHLGLQQLIDLHSRKNTQQAGGSGGNSPHGSGSLKVKVDISSGTDIDKAEMIASTVITVTGPGGSQQAAASDTETAFQNLVPGSYLVSAVPAPGWKVKPPVSSGSGASVPGNRVNISNSEAQTTLFFEKVVTKHPFFVLVRKDPLSGSFFAGVHYFSSLFSSLKATDTVPITGLLPEVVTDTSSGWIAVSDGHYIWLEITVSNGVVVAASIKCTANGQFDKGADAWGDNAYVQEDPSDPPKQTKAIKPIAKILVTGGLATVQQAVTTNLVMRSVNVAGKAALYPVAG